MNQVLDIIGRSSTLFSSEMLDCESQLMAIIRESSFLVVGGAGSIGQAVVKEIFSRSPRKLHVVDLSENNLVELVRDIRSSHGYIKGEFKTFALDIGSVEYDAFIDHDGSYDYVLNLSALKHVRSERDPFTLMRMIVVNILNTEKTLQQALDHKTKKYFCVSTDKAANPVNMMGASKKIMELFLMRQSLNMELSTARFANVAFSDGSLLQGFDNRIEKHQPIVAPNDVQRYFVTSEESGQLCLLSCIFGENRDIYFPKLSKKLNLISMSEVAKKYLAQKNFTPYVCESEDHARAEMYRISGSEWPCYFPTSDTTGEKSFEEFYTDSETLDMETYENIGIVKNKAVFENSVLENFEKSIAEYRNSGYWTKNDLVDLFTQTAPGFQHEEKGKYLDEKM
ncbi:MAG: UDP-N-acetylglucosamine 4,6-dehydratase [Halioglobus sp.]